MAKEAKEAVWVPQEAWLCPQDHRPRAVAEEDQAVAEAVVEETPRSKTAVSLGKFLPLQFVSGWSIKRMLSSEYFHLNALLARFSLSKSGLRSPRSRRHASNDCKTEEKSSLEMRTCIGTVKQQTSESGRIRFGFRYSPGFGIRA